MIFIALSLIYLLVIAIAILVATKILYSSSHFISHDAAYRGLVGVAITFIVIFIFAVIAIVANLTHWTFAPLMLVGLVVVSAAWFQFKRTEQEDLLRVLAVAADKGVPLPYAALAFSAERLDSLGKRALRLAQQLEGGMPVAEAVNQAVVGPSTASLVAIRIAEPLGNFGPALSQALGVNRQTEMTIRAGVNRYIYFGLLFALMQALLIFFAFEVLPVYQKMSRDFQAYRPEPHLPLPRSTLILTDFVNRQFDVFLPITAALILLVILYYLQMLPRNTPGLSRLLFPYDRTQVLRVLSWSVRGGKPMTVALDLIARQYPRRLVQRRIARACRFLNGGRDWCDSLQATRFLKPADAAFLRSAERAGNLAWALETLADSHLRRLVYRLKTVSIVLFPCLTILIGALIGAVCFAMFEPLAQLIDLNA